MLVAIDFEIIREAFFQAGPDWVRKYVLPIAERVSELTRAAETEDNRKQMFEVMFCEPQSFELMKDLC